MSPIAESLLGGLQADRVFVVHLRSYGFFHSGRERLRVQVLKRTWEHIPGSTLYGALAAALIRLDPPSEGGGPSQDKGCYTELLRAVEARRIRFTPLLPSSAPLESGGDYCTHAADLLAVLYGQGEAQPATSVGKLLHTTPHAPLARATEQIHGDQLFAIRTHRPYLDYYGFIFGQSAQQAWLERALGLLPVMPFGGRGKFSLVEGRLQDAGPMHEFRAKLQEWLARLGEPVWLRLLTPLVLPAAGAAEPLSLDRVEEVVMTGFRRYRVWRTGRYFNGQGFDKWGMDPGYTADDAPDLPGGMESDSVQAVPERSLLRVKRAADAVRWFIEGAGHPGWSYLGWGQVVIEPGRSAEE
jgi:hypothetical protein